MTTKMQSAVNRILNGEFNRDDHFLDFSTPRIELSVKSGRIREGSFSIHGPEGMLTEGTVTSDCLRMKCLTGAFAGSREEIAYRFDAGGLKEGETVKGEFSIISNQGEYTLPFEVTVTEVTMDSSLGNIKNLFHFTNLAKSSFEEAVRLFYSEDFARLFVGADKQYYPLYRGLTGGEKNPQNVEEFLLEIKKKQKIEFFTEEKEIRIEAPKPNTEYKITLNRNGWGFSELHIEAEGGFLMLEQTVIRDENFLGNCCRIPFYLVSDCLHTGKNLGAIRIRNAYTELVIPITVVVPLLRVRVSGSRTRKKHLQIELMQYYGAFRTRKIPASTWLKETDRIVGEMIDLDEKDMGARLMQVQILITEERYNEAKWMLEQVESQFQPGGHFEATLYSYYLYLTTLLNREEGYMDEIAGQVERIYTQNQENWRIAWLLLYLSEEFSRNPSRKWVILEKQFRQGCTSPVLYIEAYNLLLQNKTLLMKLEDFEIQILNYAIKQDMLTAELAGQIAVLGQRQKTFSARLLMLLKKCYELLPTEEVLRAVCTTLIKGNVTDRDAFDWYGLGIEKDLRITRLYEYYMMSCELDEKVKLSKKALVYFSFDSSLDSLHNAFLYSYIHRNREEYAELYESYKEQIERFVIFQMLRGKSNKWLAYLYGNILTEKMITEENAGMLAKVIFIRKLTIRRPDIRKVLLVYEKKKNKTVFDVTAREIYLPVYGNDFMLFLEDSEGNRYCRKGDYELERFLIPDKLAQLAVPFAGADDDFNLWLCERGNTFAAINESNVNNMQRMIDSGILPEEMERDNRMKLLRFYFDDDRMQELDALLDRLDMDMVAAEHYAEIISIMIRRGMYVKAYEWICRYGGSKIDSKNIMRLCSRLITMGLAEPDHAMLTLSYQAFRAGKYDTTLLQFLTEHYEGSSRNLRELYKSARAFELETYSLSERILAQLLYSDAFISEKVDIFKDYIAGGAKTELELAFLAQNCYDFFVSERVTDEFIFEDLQRAIERQEEIPLVCKLAYTRYYAENKNRITETISRYLVHYLRELLTQGMYFPYFKDYAENIGFMRQFADKTMIQYKTEEGGKAIIHYLIEKDGEYIKEEMKDMFGGICVKQFILFFGEKLQYYITEENDGRENLTVSGTLNCSDTDREQLESKYNLINDIAIGRTLNDENTMSVLLDEFFEKEFLVRKLYHIL